MSEFKDIILNSYKQYYNKPFNYPDKVPEINNRYGTGTDHIRIIHTNSKNRNYSEIIRNGTYFRFTCTRTGNNIIVDHYLIYCSESHWDMKQIFSDIANSTLKYITIDIKGQESDYDEFCGIPPSTIYFETRHFIGFNFEKYKDQFKGVYIVQTIPIIYNWNYYIYNHQLREFSSDEPYYTDLSLYYDFNYSFVDYIEDYTCFRDRHLMDLIIIPMTADYIKHKAEMQECFELIEYMPEFGSKYYELKEKFEKLTQY
jgi:hypothetical protein